MNNVNQYVKPQHVKWYHDIKNKQKSDNSQKTQHKAPQEDKFSKWPLRGVGYSNEVGEVFRAPLGTAAKEGLNIPGISNLFFGTISKKAGDAIASASYIPAIAFIAADAVDKYKKGEDGTSEKPSLKMGIRQAGFQMAASVYLPTQFVHGAQHIAKAGVALLAGQKDTVKEELHHFSLCGAKLKHIDSLVNKFKSKEKQIDIVENLAKKAEKIKPNKLAKQILSNKKASIALGLVSGLGTLAVVAKPIDEFIHKVVLGKVIDPLIGIKTHHHENKEHKA